MTEDDLEEAPQLTGAELCQAAQKNRERAQHEADMVDRRGTMERRISFEVGYNHSAFDCGHGQHGMNLRFTLIGPHGAVTWLVFMTNWVPGNVSGFGTVPAIDPVSLVVPILYPTLGDGMAADLGFHSNEPSYRDHESMDCDLLPAGYCYYDGSGLAAGPVLEAFLEHGPMAVWASLARFYAHLHEESE